MSAPVIEARGLTKRYGAKVAVDRLDLTVESGEVFGLLGPNGAGKTTTILMLLGLTEASAGSVRILGFDPLREPLKVKRHVGYLPDQIGFYDTLTGRENLRYTARLAGIPGANVEQRISTALRRVGLAEVADNRTSTYSRGMRQRLGLAEVLMRECRVAILDEPTSSLDPQATWELLTLIRELANEGMTVLVSSHMLDQMQTICDRVALFNRGRIGIMGRVEDLATQVLGGTLVIEIEASGVDVSKALEGVDGVNAVHRDSGAAWRIDAGRDVRGEVARRIVAAGGELKRLTLEHSRLGDVYQRYFQEVAHAA